MTLQTAVGRDNVDTVFVGAHPCTVTAVDKHADDTGRTDDVTCAAELIAHILEAVEGDGLTVETFLEQTEPEVAVIILNDGINLASGQVDLLTEEGIVDELVRLRIVEGDTPAVVADDDTVIAVTVERRDALVACGGHVYEVIPLLTEQSGVGGHVDIALLIGAKLSENQRPVVGEIALQRLAVVAEQSLFLRDHPKAPLFVFEQ